MNPLLRIAGLLSTFLLGLPALAQPADPDDAPTAAFPEDAADDQTFPATSSPTAGSPAGPVPSATADTAGWRARFEQAREQLVKGDYANAAQALARLEAQAPTREDAIRAGELLYVARGMQARRLTLGGSEVERPPNERTTDEIASLYFASVLYGLGTGGWLAAQTEPDSAATLIMPSLGLAAASAGVVALIDSGDPFKYGVPQGIITGTSIGLMEGITWTLWNQAKANYVDEWSGATVATVIWGSATLGAIVGGVVSSNAPTTPGRSAFTGSGALWGGALSGMVGAAAASDGPHQDETALLAAALGLNAGAAAGMLSASTVNPSVARVRFVDLGGFAGLITAGGLYISATEDNGNAGAALGVTSLGTAAGLATAWFLTADMKRELPPEDTAAEAQQEADDKLRPLVASWSFGVQPVASGAGVGLNGSLW